MTSPDITEELAGRSRSEPVGVPRTVVLNLLRQHALADGKWYSFVYRLSREIDQLEQAEVIRQATYHKDHPDDAKIRLVTAPAHLFEVVRPPTRLEDGEDVIMSMAAAEVLAQLPLSDVDWASRLILIPPYLGSIDEYAGVIYERTGSYPLIALHYAIYYAGGGYEFKPYTPGMANTHGRVRSEI